MTVSGLRGSDSYGNQRPENYGHKIRFPEKARVTRAHVAAQMKRGKRAKRK